METFPQFQSVYYGLEDGVFAGHGFSSKIANYREPGHSGYLIGENNMTVDPNMEKHYRACVNSDTGEKLPCTMSVGGKYSECIASATVEELASEPYLDCALEKCADDNSQRDCTTLQYETERVDCEANVNWCSSYAIKEAPANVTMGYISRSTHCIDHFGIPTQTMGEVIIKGQKEWANCYYNDGVTLVERSLEGDFAYCGGNVCNDTFVGAYISRDYDPRWRSWYIETKAIQRPNWSPPYPFFSTLEMGITFSLPIYSMQNDRNVFAGVLAIDYTFTDITNFLQDNYKDTPTVVAIFEMAEPHYMVASSTGSNAAKVVFTDDESKPCPNPEFRDVSCKAVRVKATDISENEMDEVVSSSFSRQKEEGFPDGQLISTKTNGGTIYAIQSQTFSVEDAKLDWYIMIMTPVETEEADQIVQGAPLFGALVSVAVIGFAICFVLVALIYRNRKKREVIVSDWRFMSAFVGGCALLNASCLSFLGPNTDQLCLTRMWLIHFFIVFALSFLFVKTYRIYRLVGARPTRTTISHAQAARMTLPFILLQTSILLIFTFVDPNKMTETITNEGSDITHRYVCEHDTPAFFIVMLIYEGGLILIGCVLAFKTRNLQDEFNESKQIILAMYDTAVIGSVLLIVSNAVVTYQGEQRLLFAVGIFWTTCFASMVFVLPRLMQVISRESQKDEYSRNVRVTVSGVQARHYPDHGFESTDKKRETGEC